MGWGSGGWSVHHPYLDGGLFLARPTAATLYALRAVAAEVERYSVHDYVAKAYDNVLYSPYLPREEFWAAFGPKLQQMGGLLDQEWVQLEHVRRVWELVWNRAITH